MVNHTYKCNNLFAIAMVIVIERCSSQVQYVGHAEKRAIRELGDEVKFLRAKHKRESQGGDSSSWQRFKNNDTVVIGICRTFENIQASAGLHWTPITNLFGKLAE
jgi:hypothetical protein